MQIYRYHWQTGLLMGTGVADPSPLEPGVFLIPAHSTTTAPPRCRPGELVRWRDNAWVVEPASAGAAELESTASGATGHDGATRLTTEQKLQALGLTVAELREALPPLPATGAAAAVAAAGGPVPAPRPPQAPTTTAARGAAGTSSASTTAGGTSGAGTSGAGNGLTVPNFNSMSIPQMQAWAHDNGIAVTAMGGSSDAKAWAAFLTLAAKP